MDFKLFFFNKSAIPVTLQDKIDIQTDGVVLGCAFIVFPLVPHSSMHLFRKNTFSCRSLPLLSKQIVTDN
jgi:hypothetical protein